MSALASSASGVVPCSGDIATPMLASTSSVASAAEKLRCSASRRRSATTSASLAVVHGRQQHGELVPAEAGERVPAADHFAEPQRDLAQQLVAVGVPKRVVDLLEAVEVDEQDRDLRVAALPRPRARVRAAPRAGRGSADRSARHASPGGATDATPSTRCDTAPPTAAAGRRRSRRTSCACRPRSPPRPPCTRGRPHTRRPDCRRAGSAAGRRPPACARPCPCGRHRARSARRSRPRARAGRLRRRLRCRRSARGGWTRSCAAGRRRS